MVRFAALVALSALSACSAPVGSWTFTVDMPEVERSADTCEENFVRADCPTAEGAQALGTRSTTGEIVTEGGHAMLVFDGEIFDGERVDGGWSFVWEDVGSTLESERLANGYTYRAERTADDSQELWLTEDGDGLVGELVTIVDTSTTWTESDVWFKADNERVSGQIAASAALEGDLHNHVNSVDCESEPCRVARGSSRVETAAVWAVPAL